MEITKKSYEFSAEKNQRLIKERNISFEDVISALEGGKLVDVIRHYNLDKYPNQKIYLVDIEGYIYLVPFVMKDKHTAFLNTIFPSRKLTARYLKNKVGV